MTPAIRKEAVRGEHPRSRHHLPPTAEQLIHHMLKISGASKMHPVMGLRSRPIVLVEGGEARVSPLVLAFAFAVGLAPLETLVLVELLLDHHRARALQASLHGGRRRCSCGWRRRSLRGSCCVSFCDLFCCSWPHEQGRGRCSGALSHCRPPGSLVARCNTTDSQEICGDVFAW